MPPLYLQRLRISATGLAFSLGLACLSGGLAVAQIAPNALQVDGAPSPANAVGHEGTRSVHERHAERQHQRGPGVAPADYRRVGDVIGDDRRQVAPDPAASQHRRGECEVLALMMTKRG